MHKPAIVGLSCLVTALCLPPLAAQSAVDTALSAVSLLRCRVSGFVLGGDSHPAGPLAPTGQLFAQLVFVGGSVARTDWALTETSQSASLHIENYVEVTAANFDAQVGENEFLIEHSSTSPHAARLELRASLIAFQGGFTMVRLDYGNDGTLDVPNLLVAGPQTLSSPDLSTDPIVVRVITESAQYSQGWSLLEIDTRLVPDVNVTATPSPVGCGGAGFLVEPAFGGAGFDVSTEEPVSAAVFGFGAQPQALPLAAAPSCLLVPSPDVVLTLPAGQPYPVAIPPALRPIALQTQLVALTQQGLTSSDSWQVLAW